MKHIDFIVLSCAHSALLVLSLFSSTILEQGQKVNIPHLLLTQFQWLDNIVSGKVSDLYQYSCHTTAYSQSAVLRATITEIGGSSCPMSSLFSFSTTKLCVFSSLPFHKTDNNSNVIIV